MALYNFDLIEKKWQKIWKETNLYAVTEDKSKPKYYVLDMFPYPSGAGLHVGHPLGYIASDIVSRYKRLQGFNVLHPMGYDAFGLPAEQYAIQTGQHPAFTTQVNMVRFREQLDRIGFSYDWDRQVVTSDPNYYKWTQWIFSKFFSYYYCLKTNKAKPISDLETLFSEQGNANANAFCTLNPIFTAANWLSYSAVEKAAVLNNYRLAFVNETTVNWCEEMGTVLANEEVVNGKSERGGYEVTRKKMKQWSLRITAYADRLLSGLTDLNWSDSIKEVQKNWIGKSIGAEIEFKSESGIGINVFTTRPDTIFGATFLVIAPEYENLTALCAKNNLDTVLAYANKAKNRSEIERMADTTKTGVDTGLRVIHPFTKKLIPVWVSDYVLAGYGTGSIMAVPAHDTRDFEFATTFNLPIINVIKPNASVVDTNLYVGKDGTMQNSDFLDGLSVTLAIKTCLEKIITLNIGIAKTNYKLREAGFGRQRYWGEPFPIVYNTEGNATLDTNLPVTLPDVESYKPTGSGESPLAAVNDWVNTQNGKRETDTMPGWAGSSWYFLRYTDPNCTTGIASTQNLAYWNQVDLYLGGSEHATGHLLYSRFWTKFLFDINVIQWEEPFKKLVNQGMIMGEDGQKMSKRWGNVVNPDDVCAEYGADTLRLYEMFLGPLTDSKPWNTQGIEGVSRFLNKLWRLFYKNEVLEITHIKPTDVELKILHKTIKKVTDDIENMSFNTSVSAFMVCVNELQTLQCNTLEILHPLLVLLAPFAPHISEELWYLTGKKSSINLEKWPLFNASILLETSFNYPISINGKTRTQLNFDLNLDSKEIEKIVLENDVVNKWLEDKPIKKVIIVKNKIINIVI